MRKRTTTQFLENDYCTLGCMCVCVCVLMSVGFRCSTKFISDPYVYFGLTQSFTGSESRFPIITIRSMCS